MSISNLWSKRSPKTVKTKFDFATTANTTAWLIETLKAIQNFNQSNPQHRIGKKKSRNTSDLWIQTSQIETNRYDPDINTKNHRHMRVYREITVRVPDERTKISVLKFRNFLSDHSPQDTRSDIACVFIEREKERTEPRIFG